MSVRAVTAVLAAVVLFALVEPVFAQCPMCRTALEQNGGQLAAGFNRGILFLLGMPYLVFGVIGLHWYRKRRGNVTAG